MMLDELAARSGQRRYPEATSRYVGRVVGTESDQRILNEQFAATPTDYGGAFVVRPAGNGVSPSELWSIREAVLANLEQVGLHLGETLKDNERTLWDRVVGATLYEKIQMDPLQLFGEDVWTYLCVHLFPEFSSWRFPGRRRQTSETDDLIKPRDRVLGGRRNVLFRVWLRAAVLGPDLRIPVGADPLGEDELDNIFGRPTISRNHELARHIVDAIYRNRPRSVRARNQVVRELMKEIKRKYSTVHFVALGEGLGEALDLLWVQAEAAARRS